MRYLNPRLSYYYLRFLKTDVRHIGILLPVLILTHLSLCAWRFVPNFIQIGKRTAEFMSHLDF